MDDGGVPTGEKQGWMRTLFGLMPSFFSSRSLADRGDRPIASLEGDEGVEMAEDCWWAVRALSAPVSIA
jgi:hypothetical protein